MGSLRAVQLSAITLLLIVGCVRPPIPTGPNVEIPRYECQVDSYDQNGRFTGGFRSYHYFGDRQVIAPGDETTVTEAGRKFSIAYAGHRGAEDLYRIRRYDVSGGEILLQEFTLGYSGGRLELFRDARGSVVLQPPVEH